MGGMFCPIVPTVGQAAASTCLSLFLFSLPGHKWIPALGYCFCYPSLLGGNAPFNATCCLGKMVSAHESPNTRAPAVHPLGASFWPGIL